jgi:hypothetical protein
MNFVFTFVTINRVKILNWKHTMHFLGLAAGIIGVLGYIPYMRDVLKGSTKPERASWFIWLIEYSALFVAQLTSGIYETLWLIGLQVIGVLIITLLSIKFGIGQFDRKSSIALFFVCATLFIWQITNNPELATVLLISIEMTGVTLTAYKVFTYPGSETLSMWVFIMAAGVLSAAALPLNSSVTAYLYPVALIIMGISVISAHWLGYKFNTSYQSTTIPLVD